jgi:hypothetical protein
MKHQSDCADRGSGLQQEKQPEQNALYDRFSYGCDSRITRALEIALYRLFYDSTDAPAPRNIVQKLPVTAWGSAGKDARLAEIAEASVRVC